MSSLKVWDRTSGLSRCFEVVDVSVEGGVCLFFFVAASGSSQSRDSGQNSINVPVVVVVLQSETNETPIQVTDCIPFSGCYALNGNNFRLAISIEVNRNSYADEEPRHENRRNRFSGKPERITIATRSMYI